MIGSLLITATCILLVAAFEKFFSQIKAWAQNILARTSLVTEATLTLKLIGNKVFAKMKMKIKWKYKPEKKTSTETISIDEVPDEIRQKLECDKKVKIMNYL
jgi:hypothetical protein